MKTKLLSKAAVILFAASFAMPMSLSAQTSVYAAEASGGSLTYNFDGNAKDKSGYAQGSITFKAGTDGSYKLYWADDTKALDGYYPIGEFKLKAGESKTVNMGYHTVIPANAKKIIATTGSLLAADACTVYDIPQNKKLLSASGNLLYTFSTFSDIHIDKGSLWYVNAEANLKNALKYSVDNNADYIIVSGDVVTNDSGPDKEWDAYQKVLSKSDYTGMVWESDGNHDMRQGVSSGLKSFVKGSGTDGSNSGKPYFYRIEEKTGDLFIFMALELNKDPKQYDEFTDEQLAWAKKLIQENYQSKNIFLIQHAPINKFGAGDRMSAPYYKGLLGQNNESTKAFKQLLIDYPNIMFLSGHTHEDFVMDYNYSDENGTAANMIHTPSLAGSTMPNSSDDGLERNGGKGFNSQAYYTEVYENEIVFYGVNMTDGKIYPKYSYIMEGSRTENSDVLPESTPRPLANVTTDITGELSKVSYILSDYYKYASYDSYQSLKKYYYEYKGMTTADKSVIDEFEARITALSAYTGDISYNEIYDTYYFVNNKDWSSVYAYAWNGSSSNASWPGVKLSKIGVNSDNKGVYSVKFSKKGEYTKIIFDGGSNTNQTVDISLSAYKYNCFSIKGSDNGKYTVNNFKYEGQNPDPDPDPDPEPQPEDDRYVLLYYVTDEHNWDNRDTFFKKGSDGVYRTSYTPKSTNNFSFSMYDSKDKKYYSLSESAKITFADKESFSYTFEKLSSRGKSITVYGLDEDAILDLEYEPESKKITVNCRKKVQITELKNTSVLEAENVKLGGYVTVDASAEGGVGEYSYALYYRRSSDKEWSVKQDFSENKILKLKPAKAVSYDICVRIKDSMGEIVDKVFTVNVFAPLKNTSVTAANIGYGESIKINASAEGGLGEYTYAVYYKKEADTKWTTKQNYSSNNVITIKPKSTTVYDISVKVKDGRGVISKRTFKVSVTKPENTSKVESESIVLGESIKISCSAKNGAGPYQYAVYYKREPADSWTLKQNYSANDTVSIKPKSATVYDISVKVKDSAGNVSKKYFKVKVVKN